MRTCLFPKHEKETETFYRIKIAEQNCTKWSRKIENYSPLIDWWHWPCSGMSLNYERIDYRINTNCNSIRFAHICGMCHVVSNQKMRNSVKRNPYSSLSCVHSTEPKHDRIVPVWLDDYSPVAFDTTAHSPGLLHRLASNSRIHNDILHLPAVRVKFESQVERSSFDWLGFDSVEPFRNQCIGDRYPTTTIVGSMHLCGMHSVWCNAFRVNTNRKMDHAIPNNSNNLYKCYNVRRAIL